MINILAILGIIFVCVLVFIMSGPMDEIKHAQDVSSMYEADIEELEDEVERLKEELDHLKEENKVLRENKGRIPREDTDAT